MKKSTKIVLSLVASTMLFTGCGGGGATTNPSSGGSAGGSDNKTPITVEKNAKAQLGVLSKAMVKVYELGTSPHKLLWTEITTEGDTVEAIGNFNAHEKELKADKFYLYEVLHQLVSKPHSRRYNRYHKLLKFALQRSVPLELSP